MAAIRLDKLFTIKPLGIRVYTLPATDIQTGYGPANGFHTVLQIDDKTILSCAIEARFVEEVQVEALKYVRGRMRELGFDTSLDGPTYFLDNYIELMEDRVKIQYDRAKKAA